MKIADFGLTRNLNQFDYYRKTTGVSAEMVLCDKHKYGRLPGYVCVSLIGRLPGYVFVCRCMAGYLDMSVCVLVYGRLPGYVCVCWCMAGYLDMYVCWCMAGYLDMCVCVSV